MNKTKKKVRVGSLFAGVGGIDLAFKNAGADIIYANDCDEKAMITYKENFNNMFLNEKIEDIEAENLPEVDIITFGFPCTSFSIAGYQKGFEDEKTGHLFFEALKIILKTNTQAFFLENVRNLVSHDKGKTFKIIKDSLIQNGFHIKYKIMNAKDYSNIPQNRDRIYMVGFKDIDKANEFEFPEEVKLEKRIADIINTTERKDDRYYYTSKRTKYYPLLKENVVKKDTLYQLRRVYVRENKSQLCPTLTANMGTGGHNVPILLDNYGIRQLTPRECFDFQGFPKDFKLPDIANCHLYKQAGNSVVVPLVERIAKNMIDLY